MKNLKKLQEEADALLSSANVLARKHFQNMKETEERITTLSIANMLIELSKRA